MFKDGKAAILNTGNLTLQTASKKYTPDKTICYKFKTLGNCYKKQYITETENDYIVAYRVGKLNIKRSFIIYTDSFDKQYKVKLKLQEA